MRAREVSIAGEGSAPGFAALVSPASLAREVTGSGPLYAVLDAARDPAVLDHLVRSEEIFESLYSGRRALQLATAAPYLAQISSNSSLLDALAREGWGRSWGVLLAAHAPFAEIRRHLRTFLTVETEEGEALSFRFYDPRVLRPFLASATPSGARAFLGPIEALFVEGPDPSQLYRFERVGPAARTPPPPRDLPRLRDEQCARLAEEVAAAFVERNALRLAGGLRAWAEGAEGAKRLVEQAVVRAEGHGIEAAGDVERYLDLVAALGPGFDERLPWARRLLARDDLTQAHKLARIERRVRRERGSRAY
jgi:hypothetical protein